MKWWANGAWGLHLAHSIVRSFHLSGLRCWTEDCEGKIFSGFPLTAPRETNVHNACLYRSSENRPDWRFCFHWHLRCYEFKQSHRDRHTLAFLKLTVHRHFRKGRLMEIFFFNWGCGTFGCVLLTVWTFSCSLFFFLLFLSGASIFKHWYLCLKVISYSRSQKIASTAFSSSVTVKQRERMYRL